MVVVRGVAYSGGSDCNIAEVQISSDKGQNWQVARCLFEEITTDDSSRMRGWVRFEADLKLPWAHQLGCGGALSELWCRALGERGEVQPERSEAHGGYLYNGYHKVPIVRR